jgi:hypothetical protein
MQPITVPNVVIRGPVRNNAGKLSAAALRSGVVSHLVTPPGIGPGNLLPPLGARYARQCRFDLVVRCLSNSRHVESLLTLL